MASPAPAPAPAATASVIPRSVLGPVSSTTTANNHHHHHGHNVYSSGEKDVKSKQLQYRRLSVDAGNGKPVPSISPSKKRRSQSMGGGVLASSSSTTTTSNNMITEGMLSELSPRSECISISHAIYSTIAKQFTILCPSSQKKLVAAL